MRMSLWSNLPLRSGRAPASDRGSEGQARSSCMCGWSCGQMRRPKHGPLPTDSGGILHPVPASRPAQWAHSPTFQTCSLGSLDCGPISWTSGPILRSFRAACGPIFPARHSHPAVASQGMLGPAGHGVPRLWSNIFREKSGSTAGNTKWSNQCTGECRRKRAPRRAHW